MLSVCIIINNLTELMIVRAIIQPFQEIDDLITKFSEAFKTLQADFDTGVVSHTALVLTQTASAVDEICGYRMYFITFYLLKQNV